MIQLRSFILWTLIVCGGLIGLSLLLGQMIETDSVITYQDLDGYRSATIVMDSLRDFRLDLGSKRCFKKLPDWVWDEMVLLGYSPESTSQRVITLIDVDPAATIERLNCARIEAGKPLGLPDS